jgi:hypothetical protein
MEIFKTPELEVVTKSKELPPHWCRQRPALNLAWLEKSNKEELQFVVTWVERGQACPKRTYR